MLLVAGLIAGTFICGRGDAAGADDKPAATRKSESPKEAGRKGEDQSDGEEKSGKEAESARAKAQMAVMRRIAGELTVSAIVDEPLEAELIPEALFRSHDPARENSPDGSIWGYGKKGRPAALLSLALKPPVDGRPGWWMNELNSLSIVPVEGKIPGLQNWSTRKPGLEFREFPDSPPAAEKEAGRTRQLRELSARFTGFETLQSKGPDAPAERFELRLIPRPIHRYSDPGRGQVDGALFLMTYSTNPEIVMVIELAREGAKNVWKYAFNRIAFAELHVDLDGKEVWTQPQLRGTSSADPYWLFSRPIGAGEVDPK